MACFAPQAVEYGTIDLHPQGADGGRAPFNSKLIAVVRASALTVVACTTMSHAQTGDATAQTAPTPQQQSAPLEGNAAPAADLSDLNAVTFSCVRAGLNAAGREAAKAKSQGTYQFSYFKIIKDTHHSFYEVHFKSNYSGEPDLKYCVAIYCQQGWDPKTTQISVSPIDNERQRPQVAAHESDCGDEHMPVKRRAKR
jgi:hypothetical protein